MSHEALIICKLPQKSNRRLFFKFAGCTSKGNLVCSRWVMLWQNRCTQVRSTERYLSFIHEDFLLHSRASQGLYHGYAKTEPILDFHSHLPAAEIAQDRRFQDLTEIWLEGDHYKWRAMRANGVPERYCTGDATAYAKFSAWARTAPFTLRNPLYHWTHLELGRYFGIHELLNEHSASAMWEQANSLLAKSNL